MAFWIFEIHNSDGNDNWISEAYVEGADYRSARRSAIDAIRARLESRGSKIQHESGDGECSHYFMIEHSESCPEGEDCEKERCSLDHRAWSVSLYFQESDCSEAEYDAPLSRYHAFTGNILDA